MDSNGWREKIPKILAPINSYEGAVGVINAGADEVYCGVGMPGRFRNFMLYRGPGATPAQLPSYDDLERIVQYAHGRGAEVVVVVNEPFMSETMKEEMREHIHSCFEKDVDALIIGDLGVLSLVKDMELDLPLYASTYFVSMNYAAVNFLERLGFERVILERHLTIPEIFEIVENSKVDVEVFVHSAGCSNLNGSCHLHYFQRLHRLGTDTIMLAPSRSGPILSTTAVPCMLRYEIIDANNGDKIGDYPIMDALTYCSMCHLPSLLQAGVTGLKIVGRLEDPRHQEVYTKAYRQLLDFITSPKYNPEAFEKKIKEMRKEIMKVKFDKLPLSDTEIKYLINLGDYVFKERYCRPERCYYSPLFNAPYKTEEFQQERFMVR
jgi:putative protease